MTRRDPRHNPRGGDHLTATYGEQRHVSRVDSRGVLYTGSSGRENVATLDQWRAWAAGATVRPRRRKPQPKPGAVACWDADTGSPLLGDGTVYLHGHLASDDPAIVGTLREYEIDLTVVAVEQVHCRYVPDPDDREIVALHQSAAGRGAFPVTIVTLAGWEVSDE